MNCESCPFNSTKVLGEGSRIIKEYNLEEKKGNLVFKTHMVERDNEGEYDVVVVGMAPAREEVKEGRPFVGVSGQILRKTLEQMGVKEFYITNVLQCPITDEALVPQALKVCRPVIDEVLARRPKLVIALGDLPLHVLADTNYSIKEVEGRVIPSKVGPLLPITHPAYYYRRPEEFFDFIECMRSGVKFLDGNYEQAGEPTLELVTPDNLSEVKQHIDKFEELGIDLETTGFFAYGWEPDHILEMGLAVAPDHAFIVRKDMVGEFKDLLESKKCVFWNAQFDCAFLKQVGITPNVHFDGMLAHYSIDERPYSHGLKRVAKIYLGADDWEKDLDKWIPKRQKKSVSYEVIPSEVREVYLSKDVTRTLQLKKVLEEDINKKVFWEMLMPACRMFIEIENKGIRIDPVKLMNLEDILVKELSKLGNSVNEEIGGWVNPLSYKQVSELLYGQMGVPIDPYFGPSTSKVALDQYREQYEVIGKILDYREIAKLSGTYVEGFARFVDKNYHIHPSIKLFGSVTGRLSSENPSIMNLKSVKELKEIFLPHLGYLLGYFDIKGNELRWYYLYSHDERLGKILKDPKGDPHHLVASIAYGEERAKEMRSPAKAVVFGRIYRRGIKSIEYQVGKEVIDDLMETVDALFPDVGKYSESIMRQVKSKGYVESYFGRKRRFGLITPESAHRIEREAINSPIQSAGSDLMLLSFLHLWANKERLGIYPFWPVHDSITADIPNPEIIPIIKKELEDYAYELVKGIVPFIWETDWGYDLSMRKEPL